MKKKRSYGMPRERNERMKDVPEFRKLRELEELGKTTVRDFIIQYISARRGRLSEIDFLTLHAFARRPICSKRLPDFNRQDANRWVSERLNEERRNGEGFVTPRTVSRDRNTIQRAWSFAIEYLDGFANLPNPWDGIRIATRGQTPRPPMVASC